MTHGSLFSGIGGFDLAAEWMGWENIFHCEWNPFGQKVLKYHFPNSISYDDITKTDFTIHRGTIDILTGGFPCQPYSMAGKRLGKEDERHLWPEMLRAIREIQPRWVVGENVLGLVNWSGGLVFHEVQADLEAEGYEVQPYVLPACAVNAPHRRDRVWFVAKNTKRDGFVFGEPKKEGAEIRQFGNTCTGDSIGVCGTKVAGIATDTYSNGLNERNGNDEKQPGKGGLDALNDINEVTMHTNGTSKQGKHIGQTREGKFNGPDSGNGFNNFQNFPSQSPICTGDDGISSRLDGITFSKWRNESIKAGGNAIVPQVVYQIFKAIEQYETQALSGDFHQ
jgi:DNA (cytosine-5)-methyltransferase 1